MLHISLECLVVVNSDPWQTTVEWYNIETGFQPLPVQDNHSNMYSEGQQHTAATEDYFNFINPAGDNSKSASLEKYLDVDMVIHYSYLGTVDIFEVVLVEQ